MSSVTECRCRSLQPARSPVTSDPPLASFLLQQFDFAMNKSKESKADPKPSEKEIYQRQSKQLRSLALLGFVFPSDHLQILVLPCHNYRYI